MVLQNKSIIAPSLADAFLNLRRDIFANLHCVKVGQISAFDTAKKTAQVQILFKRVRPDGTTQSYPLLVDCPVVTLQGGGGSLQFPIAVGDQCLVLFADRRLDEWFQNGAEAAPGDARLHDLSDGIALVGLNALNSALPTYPTSQVLLKYAGSQLVVDAGGLKLVGQGGAEVDVEAALVTIKNNTTTLLALLNGLITVIEGLQVNGPIALTAASVTALEAYKLQLATLLG